MTPRLVLFSSATMGVCPGCYGPNAGTPFCATCNQNIDYETKPTVSATDPRNRDDLIISLLAEPDDAETTRNKNSRPLCGER
jgi:hypothetical protein